MNRPPIKLYPVKTLIDGTILLQSQLCFIYGDSIDFILKEDGLYVWGWEAVKGFDYHKTDIPYEIVKDKKDMLKQKL